jgi:aromatic ring-cleaving dioxygenase
MIRSYDAHIYYPLNKKQLAATLHDQALADLPFARVSPLVDRNVGPHPMPMFEIQFTPEHHSAVLTWLLAHRGELAVLVHEVTGDDPRDHSQGALWMGRVLELDFSKLDPSPLELP